MRRLLHVLSAIWRRRIARLRPAARGGFTLVQMTVLLTAASLVLVTVLPSVRQQTDSAKATQQRMDEIMRRLRAYQTANYGSLPCPADSNYGTDHALFGKPATGAGPTNDCNGTPSATYRDTTNDVAIGAVPVRALGLPKDYAFDAYGRFITYMVDTNATLTCWTAPLTGKITVTDYGRSTLGVVALVSHGADGHGAAVPVAGTATSGSRMNTGSTDTDSLTNAHVNSSFASTSSLAALVNKAATSTYDDLVMYNMPQFDMATIPSIYTSSAVPTVTGPSAGTYGANRNLNFTLTYAEAITVSGTPRVSLTVGNNASASNTRYATYASGSGTTALVFTYATKATDIAPAGIAISSPVELNGGTMTGVNSSCVNRNFVPSTMSTVLVDGFSGVATDASARRVIADTNNNRIQRFTTAEAHQLSFGSAGSSNGLLNVPTGVTVDPSGNIWVVDTGNSRVQQFATGGSYTSQFGASGTGSGFFIMPTGIVADSSGNLWVVDTGNNRVQKFNSSGVHQLTVGSAGTGNGQFSHPTGIAVDSSSNIFVVDTGNNRVQKFNSSGTYQSQFGSYGTGNGQFSFPTGITLTNSDDIWIADTGNNRLQKFTSAMAYNAQCGTLGTGDGQLDNPSGMAMTALARPVVIDSDNSRYQQFNTTCSYLAKAGTYGSSNGQFNF